MSDANSLSFGFFPGAAGSPGAAAFSAVVATAGGATPLVYLDFINQFYSYNGAAPVAILAFPGMNFVRSGAVTILSVAYPANTPVINALGFLSQDHGANGFDRMRIVNADQVSTHTQFSDMQQVDAQNATSRCMHTLSRTQADGSNRSQCVIDSLAPTGEITRLGVSQMSQVSTALSAGSQSIKYGIRCAANDGNIIIGGALGTQDVTVTVPDQLDEVYVGINSNNNNGFVLTGYTRRYILWQTGLSDAQLTAVSALNP